MLTGAAIQLTYGGRTRQEEKLEISSVTVCRRDTRVFAKTLPLRSSMATHEISPNRARKRYLASKQGNEGTDADWTPFRVKEKHFKTKWPKPDLANVLDLATLFEHRTDEVSQSGWTGGSTSARKIATTLPNSYGQNLAFAVPEIPGATHLLHVDSNFIHFPRY